MAPEPVLPPPPAPQVRPRTWPRLLLVEALQLVPLALILAGRPPWSLWVAGIAGSAICCAGTDSGWRWRNRLLVAQAALWLLVPMVFG